MNRPTSTPFLDTDGIYVTTYLYNLSHYKKKPFPTIHTHILYYMYYTYNNNDTNSAIT